jgi:hypothetical protein
VPASLFGVPADRGRLDTFEVAGADRCLLPLALQDEGRTVAGLAALAPVLNR